MTDEAPAPVEEGPAVLPLTPSAYDEIEGKLREMGHPFTIAGQALYAEGVAFARMEDVEWWKCQKCGENGIETTDMDDGTTRVFICRNGCPGWSAERVQETSAP